MDYEKDGLSKYLKSSYLPLQGQGFIHSLKKNKGDEMRGIYFGGVILAVTIAVAFGSLNAFAEESEETKPSASADVGIFSKYIWRGWELSDDSVVIQPSITAEYKGFSMNLWGNLDTDVDDAIENTRPAGIPVNWYGVTSVDIYVDVTVDVDPDLVPADGASQIETGIVNYLTGLSSGDDVIYSKLIDAIYDVEEDETDAWIRDITSLKIGTSSPPTSESNLTIAKNQKATSDVTKVDVTTFSS